MINQGLIRVLMAYHRREHGVARIVQVPSPQEEDAKRLLRSRGNLLRERMARLSRQTARKLPKKPAR